METTVSPKYVVTSCEAAECDVQDERRVRDHNGEKICYIG